MADDIDIYGNIEDDEFRQEGNEFANEDLYDDIITEKPASRRAEPKGEKIPLAKSSKLVDRGEDVKQESTYSSMGTSQNYKRYSTYVGNLTWWTTDIDILNALKGLDIDDVVEIKFHENRQNGQSKGFCVVVFSSEAMSKKAMERLPTIEIHGQKPLITYCNRQNLLYFEKQSGGASDDITNSDFPSGNLGSSSGHHSSNFSNSAAAAVAYNATKGATSGLLKNSLLGGPSRNSGGGRNSHQSSDASQLLQQVSAIANLLPPSAMAAIRGSLFPGAVSQSSTNVSANTFHNSTGSGVGSINSLMPTPSVSLMSSNPISSSRTPFVLPPAGATAHINPNFFGSNAVANGSISSLTGSHSTSNPSNPLFGNLPGVNFPGALTIPPPAFPPPPVMNPSMLLGNASISGTTVPSTHPIISDFEFNDIFDRNKAVSTSAINRALQDAAAGDYASAIETLVTAISLIKQSKIAGDDRCRVLINSLQDTLHSIESKFGTPGPARVTSPRSSSRRRHRQRSGTPSDHGYDDRHYERRRESREDSYPYHHRREGHSTRHYREDGSRSRHHGTSRSPSEGHYSKSRRDRSPGSSVRDDYYTGSSSHGYSSRR